MKNLVTVLVVILCLAGFLRLAIAGPNDKCTAADDFGYLDIDYVDQVETSWCWVASANAVTNHFGLTDPAKANAPYIKCSLYEIAENLPADYCCNNTLNCQKSGWPYEVFENLKPEIYYKGEGNWMEWSDIKEQICPGLDWHPGHPFIFMAQSHTTGIKHTHVVKGFGHDIVGAPQLLIDDHSGWGAKFIEYECKYKLPANCQASGAQWDRVGDLKDLKPVYPNLDPSPAAPLGLSIH